LRLGLGRQRDTLENRCGPFEPVALSDVIFTEVLQGLRSEDEAQLVERHLRAFPILRLEGLDHFALAAGLYRAARRQAVTIRKTPPRRLPLQPALSSTAPCRCGSPPCLVCRTHP